jgi:hypothetical protein
VKPFPPASTAIQNNDDAHETEFIPFLVVSIWTGELHELPLNVSASSENCELSTPMQNDDDEHETEVSPLASTWAGAPHELPLNVCACPFPPTATQNDDDGHDTELEALMLVGPDHPEPANADDGTRSALTVTPITATIRTSRLRTPWSPSVRQKPPRPAPPRDRSQQYRRAIPTPPLNFVSCAPHLPIIAAASPASVTE